MGTQGRTTAGIPALTDEIIAGRRLSQSDDLSFFADCSLASLTEGADRLRKHFSGD